MTAAAKSFLQGKTPTVKVSPYNPEREKYERAWNIDAYRKYSPGEDVGVRAFLEVQPFKVGQKVIDFGCGTGRAGYELYRRGLDVTLVDFIPHCLDEHVRNTVQDHEGITFLAHDLTQPLDIRANFGLCCDVMEHIPEDQVDDVLINVLKAADRVLFQIATVEDHFGHHDEINAPLHVCVHSYTWWLKKFAELGCVIHKSDEFPGSVLFYVSAYREMFFGFGTVNVDREAIEANMRENANVELPQLLPHDEQATEVMLLCGGPSLADYWGEIAAARAAGMPMITCNGTYNQALERGIRPSMQFVIDAREHNKRFVEPIVDDCKYAVATQCHPETVKAVPADRSFFWQVTLEKGFIPIIEELWGKQYETWAPVPGGCTVGLRTLCALQMLGYRKVHVYGLDSCLMDDKHHAYEQAENDNANTLELTVARGTPNERTFDVHGWMAQQAKDFEGLVKMYFQDMQLNIKGDGLIAYLVKTGAEAP